MTTNRLRLLSGPLPALAAVMLCYGVSLAALPSGGFWVIDNGEKYLQMLSAIQSGYGSVVVRWPGRILDPALALNPLPSMASFVKDGELFFHFPPVFAIVSSIPYRIFGEPGLTVLPLLSGLLMLLGLERLSRRLGLGPVARSGAVLLAGLGTPLWFYSVTFWEHIVAVCLVIWSLEACFAYGDNGKKAFLCRGAALAGASIYFRDEFTLLLPVLLIVLALLGPRSDAVKRLLIFSAVWALSLVPLLGINLYYTGNPAGFHLLVNLKTSHSLHEHLQQRWLALYRLFVAFDPRIRLSVLAGLPFLILFAANPRLPRRIYIPAVPLLALASTAGFLLNFAGYFGPGGPLSHLLKSNSLFAASPALILGMVRDRDDHSAPFSRVALWLIMILYAAVYWLATPVFSTEGIHWGNRFLLVLYPPLALLCAGTLSHWWRLTAGGKRWGRAAVAAALAASLAAQLYSMTLLYRAKDFSDRFNTAVSKAPEDVIVTSSWWMPLQLHRNFFSKKIFLLRRGADVEGFLRRVKARGISSILLAESVRFAPRPSETEARRSEIVDDGGLNYYSVRLRRLQPQLEESNP